MYRLLIVGKDGGEEERCRRELQAEGFDVDLVTDGGQAIARVDDERPDLVILDLCMPGDAGFACLDSVRRRDASLPVVLHTAYPDSWGDFRLWSADRFVERSGDLTELKEAVRHLLPTGPRPDADRR